MTQTQRRRVVSVLERALERISEPERWTRGAFARNANGEPVGPTSTSAERFCALGALRAATKSQMLLHRAHLVLELSLSKKGAFNVSSYNDGPWRQHRHIVALYRRAIRRAKADAARA